jgi:hypothetical protein
MRVSKEKLAMVGTERAGAGQYCYGSEGKYSPCDRHWSESAGDLF